MRQIWPFACLFLSKHAICQNLKLTDPYTEYDSLRFNFKNAENKEITVWPELYSYPIIDTQQINNGLVAILGSDYVAQLAWTQNDINTQKSEQKINLETSDLGSTNLFSFSSSKLSSTRSNFQNCFIYSLDQVTKNSFGVICNDFGIQLSENNYTTQAIIGINGQIKDITQRGLLLYIITTTNDLLWAHISPNNDNIIQVNQFKNFPDDELVKIQVCGPENPAILALSTVRGMNYTVISENAASMEKWNWDFGYGLLDNVVTSLSCDSDNGYTLYLGQKQGTLHHRVPYTNSKTGLPDAGLYYRTVWKSRKNPFGNSKQGIIIQGNLIVA